MFVITADQVDSRHHADLAVAAIADLTQLVGTRLVLPVDRTAGDEIQLLIEHAPDALATILALTRSSQWSVGCGLGDVNLPLPANAREAGGDAFIAAREAVIDAKKRGNRFALRSAQRSNAAALEIAETEALITLLLQIRAGRSREGWQIYDLLALGMTQAAAAVELGITPQAASKRAQAAAIRVEFTAMSALENRLQAAELTARVALPNHTEGATNP